MDQLTIRDFDDELSAILHHLAKREGISLDQAALRLLRKGAGLTDGKEADTVGSSLDHLIGTWTAAQADELDLALRDFETIDDHLNIDRLMSSG